MKRLFGSLNNRLMEGTVGQPEPEVGMGATELCYSDRHAYTIVAVHGPARIEVRADVATRTDANGMSDSQSYSYAPGPEDAPTRVLTKRKNNAWIPQGQPMRNGTRFALGIRDEHYDFSF